MSFERPSLDQLISRAAATLGGKLGERVLIDEHTPEAALANMVAALNDGALGHLAYLGRQIFPLSCDEPYLARHAAALAVPRSADESVGSWRRRIDAARRDLPGGGNSADLLRWTRGVPGVGRAWVVPVEAGLGTVGILFAPLGDYDRDQALGLRPLVQAALDARPPLGVRKIAIAPGAHVVDLELQLRPSDAATCGRVVESLREFFRSFEPGQRVIWSQLRRAIAATAGLRDHRVRLPWSDIDIAQRYLPVLGNVTFSSF